MIALVEAIHAGLFRRDNILPNILAGIVAGIVTIPLSMAFAIASDVKPEIGLYSSIVVAFCISVFGGSRVHISGPTGALVGLLLSISAQFGNDGLQLTTILAGTILVLMGLLHCGKMIRFIPEQVIIGFTLGIAINLLIGQLPGFCGLTCERLSVHFSEKIIQLYHAFPTLDPHTTILAVISLLILMFNKYTILRPIPAQIVALFCGITIQSIGKFDTVLTIGSAFGGIPQTLPDIQIPSNITFAKIYSLLPSAFALAMLCAIESLLSALIADRVTGRKHSSNQELIGEGIGNMIAPLFGGIASAGSIARTAASIRTGGNSPLAGITSSITLIVVICFCAPLANNIPLATLSAIIFMVALNMLKPSTLFIFLKRYPKLDVIILLVTCGLTIACGIVFAVNIGVILSAFVLIYRLTKTTDIRNDSGNIINENPRFDNVAIYSITGPLFFGILEKFDHMVENLPFGTHTLILNFSGVPFIDTTGLQALSRVISQFKNTGKKIIIAEANFRVIKKLNRAHIMDSTAHNNLTLTEALNIVNNDYSGTIVPL